MNDDPFQYLSGITREVGSRFSQKSRNASRILFFWVDIENFSRNHCPELHNFFTHPNINLIKEELTALSFMWYSLLYPLWTDLATANVPAGMKLILGKCLNYEFNSQTKMFNF